MNDERADAQSQIAALEKELAELQRKYDQLTGERFSDRVHAALRDRAERSEAQFDALTARCAVLEKALREIVNFTSVPINTTLSAALVSIAQAALAPQQGWICADCGTANLYVNIPCAKCGGRTAALAPEVPQAETETKS